MAAKKRDSWTPKSKPPTFETVSPPFQMAKQSAPTHRLQTPCCSRINAVISTTECRDQYSSCGHSWQHEVFNLDFIWTVQTKRVSENIKTKGKTRTHTTKLNQSPLVLHYLTNNSMNSISATLARVLETPWVSTQTPDLWSWCVPSLLGRVCKWSWQTATEMNMRSASPKSH